MRRGTLTLAVAIVSSGLMVAGSPQPAGTPQGSPPPRSTPISFNREIQPILANNCFACHGPDEKKRETKFHFDTQEGMFAKRGVIEPGNAAESLLVEKISVPNP
jgi:hypothetical protein